MWISLSHNSCVIFEIDSIPLVFYIFLLWHLNSTLIQKIFKFCLMICKFWPKIFFSPKIECKVKSYFCLLGFTFERGFFHKSSIKNPPPKKLAIKNLEKNDGYSEISKNCLFNTETTLKFLKFDDWIF